MGDAVIAALYVYADGPYAEIDGVDVWDVSRDARRYDGTHPVIAHPPCTRWCRLAGLVEARWGHLREDDAGCFASALRSVYRCGGVLEHPAYSDAWHAYGLPVPRREGGWTRGLDGGWSCHVEQGRYGHAAKKATWLYVCGVHDLPELRWGPTPDADSLAAVSWCGNRTWHGAGRKRVGKRAASETPPEFREVLLGIARAACGATDAEIGALIARVDEMDRRRVERLARRRSA